MMFPPPTPVTIEGDDPRHLVITEIALALEGAISNAVQKGPLIFRNASYEFSRISS